MKCLAIFTQSKKKSSHNTSHCHTKYVGDFSLFSPSSSFNCVAKAICIFDFIWTNWIALNAHGWRIRIWSSGKPLAIWWRACVLSCLRVHEMLQLCSRSEYPRKIPKNQITMHHMTQTSCFIFTVYKLSVCKPCMQLLSFAFMEMKLIKNLTERRERERESEGNKTVTSMKMWILAKPDF